MCLGPDCERKLSKGCMWRHTTIMPGGSYTSGGVKGLSVGQQAWTRVFGEQHSKVRLALQQEYLCTSVVIEPSAQKRRLKDKLYAHLRHKRETLWESFELQTEYTTKVCTWHHHPDTSQAPSSILFFLQYSPSQEWCHLLPGSLTHTSTSPLRHFCDAHPHNYS